MRKILMFFFTICLAFYVSSQDILAENLSYPFQSITITEAITFEVLIPDTLEDTSLLYGLVEPGKTLTVYVATIIFQEMNGEYNGSPSYVLILTNEDDEDIIRFIVNSSYQKLGVERYQSFASHILIDANMGVYKDLDGIDPLVGMQEISVHHIFDGDKLSLIDNKGLEIPMIEGSYQFEAGLNIVISMNQGE